MKVSAAHTQILMVREEYRSRVSLTDFVQFDPIRNQLNIEKHRAPKRLGGYGGVRFLCSFA